MNTTKSIRLISIGVVLVTIAIFLVILGGSVNHVKAENPFTSKNDLQPSEQPLDIGSFDAQAPDTASKNYSGSVSPDDPMGTTVSVPPELNSKNYTSNNEP